MSYEVSQSLEFICNQISKQCANFQLKQRFEFVNLLKPLNATERFIVAKYFCRLPWNIGSLRVLQVLQELRLLTSTEFILSINDSEQLQLILNDFLEAEFDLIVNLFITATYDVLNAIKLNSILDDALRSLYADLLNAANINNLEYLNALSAQLSADALQKVTQKHVNIILELHSSDVKAAFCNFSNWINEGVDDIQFTKKLCKQLLSKSLEGTINYMLKVSTLEHFKEWKFYLILLQTISSQHTAEVTSFIKKYFKSRLQQLASTPNCLGMLHLLLSIRAATATTMNIEKNLNSYADWYKTHIADMKFIMDTTQFQNVINMLEECISYENELQYLEIHALITISPPVLCGKLVQGYKSKCKMRLSQLKDSHKCALPAANDTNESIVIDDSD